MKALILLSSLGVIALLAEIFSFRKLLYPLVILGLVVTFIVNILDWNTDHEYFGMMRYDNFAVAFAAVLIGVALLWFFMAEKFFVDGANYTDHFALIIFALAGGIILVSFSNMSMLFLGVEILSIPMYVMAGSRKEDTSSNEAAFKYLIMGAFATGFLLFGITLVYGATGSFDLPTIAEAVAGGKALPGIFLAGMLLMLIGMAFKVSAAPFHFWAPDVYQGSPVQVTAFMSTIVKTAAFAAFLRLFMGCFTEVSESWVNVIWGLSALTLLVGNITAVVQDSAKRMLAYSSIAHAGYMLIALVAMNDFTTGSVLFYAISYSLASIASFGILAYVVGATGSEDVNAFNGLARKNPLLAVVMTVALLSLAGIPPTAGFFAKYYIFTAAFASGFGGLVLVAILASLIGVYYYFRIIIAMFFREPDQEIAGMPGSHKLLYLVLLLLTVALGVAPDLIISLF